MIHTKVMPAPLRKVDLGMKRRFCIEIGKGLCDWERTAKRERVLKTTLLGVQLQLSHHHFIISLLGILSQFIQEVENRRFYFSLSNCSSEHIINTI